MARKITASNPTQAEPLITRIAMLSHDQLAWVWTEVSGFKPGAWCKSADLVEMLTNLARDAKAINGVECAVDAA